MNDNVLNIPGIPPVKKTLVSFHYSWENDDAPFRYRRCGKNILKAIREREKLLEKGCKDVEAHVIFE